MKMIKAIFLDIDGTLISGKRPSIKKEVIEGLKHPLPKQARYQLRYTRILLILE